MALARRSTTEALAEEEVVGREHSDPSELAGQLRASDMRSPCVIDGRWGVVQFGSCCCRNRWKSRMPANQVGGRKANCDARDCMLEACFPEGAFSVRYCAQL
jgi:hypothetical protein